MSPFETFFDPAEKAEELNKIPPDAAVLPTVLAPELPVTTIFPVMVAVPVMENEVVVADLAPPEAALHPMVTRVLDVMMPDAISVTVGAV